MFNFFRRGRRGVPAELGVAVVDITAFPDRHTERCADSPWWLSRWGLW
ncbi:hypothetical protein [Streptomyces lydicus]